MNRENVSAAINIIQRAGRISSSSWQERPDIYTNVKLVEEELHICNIAASPEGWIAVSPEWKKFGGKVNYNGAPKIPLICGDNSDVALAFWLDLAVSTVSLVMHGLRDSSHKYREISESYSFFYEKTWGTVTAEDFASKLQLILAYGEVAFLEEFLSKIEDAPTEQCVKLYKVVKLGGGFRTEDDDNY